MFVYKLPECWKNVISRRMKLCPLAGSHQYHRWCSAALPSSGRGSNSTGCQYRLDQFGRRSDEEQRPTEGRSVCLTAAAEHLTHKYLHRHTASNIQACVQMSNFCCACFASDFVQDLIPVSHSTSLHSLTLLCGFP